MPTHHGKAICRRSSGGLLQHRRTLATRLRRSIEDAPTQTPRPAHAPTTAMPSKPNQEQQQEPPRDASFGDLIPFGDPAWYHDWHSPYYKDSHRRLRAAMREFVDREVM